MKNSSILLANFLVRCQKVVKFSLKLSLLVKGNVFGKLISINQKVDTTISKISTFPRAIGYDISISNRYFDTSKHH